MRLDAQQRRAILAHPAGWIASGFGSGLSPFAPGTAGSAAALLPWLALRELPWPLFALIVALAFALGVWASNVVIAKLRIEDPQVIVWDEFVGQSIALAPLLWIARDWRWIIAAFLLFRLFDVWKPWPVSWADRCVKGGLGVMLDDVIAGIYAAIVIGVCAAYVSA
ncbi:MAG: phosphatidylglycerophosphatase A [Dokdonella sp.]